MTLPNMMPTSGTMTASLNWMRWMNQTKTQVPRMAAPKAKSARLQSVEAGKNSRASRMPNCAEEMVAPVVGETNLLLQSCCIMSPATLMPTPVHRIASSRGRRETTKTSSWCRSPDNKSRGVRSMTPTKSEQIASTTRASDRRMVERLDLSISTPFLKTGTEVSLN